jgi:hypothetical protein
MDEQEEQATSFSPGNFLPGDQCKKGSRDFHDSSPVGVRTPCLSEAASSSSSVEPTFFTQQENSEPKGCSRNNEPLGKP